MRKWDWWEADQHRDCACFVSLKADDVWEQEITVAHQIESQLQGLVHHLLGLAVVLVLVLTPVRHNLMEEFITLVQRDEKHSLPVRHCVCVDEVPAGLGCKGKSGDPPSAHLGPWDTSAPETGRAAGSGETYWKRKENRGNGDLQKHSCTLITAIYCIWSCLDYRNKAQSTHK